MFFCVPFMQNMENDKDGTSSRLTEYGLGFQKPPTSWAATSEAQIKHALRCSHIKRRLSCQKTY